MKSRPIQVLFDTGICSSIIEGGLKDVLTNIGWEVTQLPPLSFDQSKRNSEHELPNIKNCASVGEASRIIKERVSAASQPDTFSLILGGDHCVAIGTISGIKEKRPNNAVVWVNQFCLLVSSSNLL